MLLLRARVSDLHLRETLAWHSRILAWEILAPCFVSCFRSSVSVVLRFLFQHPLSALTSLPKVAVAFLYETSHNKLSELSNTRP